MTPQLSGTAGLPTMNRVFLPMRALTSFAAVGDRQASSTLLDIGENLRLATGANRGLDHELHALLNICPPAKLHQIRQGEPTWRAINLNQTICVAQFSTIED